MCRLKPIAVVSTLIALLATTGAATAEDAMPLRLRFSQGWALGTYEFVEFDASEGPTPHLIERTVDSLVTGGTETSRRRYTVSAESWIRFRKELDALHAWTWRDRCINTHVYDGTTWRLQIVYPTHKIKVSGRNAFPKAGGGCEYDLHRSREYRRLNDVLRRIADD